MKDLRELRRMANLTQFELAQRCSVSRMRLSQAECGQLALEADEEASVRKILLRRIEDQAARIRNVLSRAEEQPEISIAV